MRLVRGFTARLGLVSIALVFAGYSTFCMRKRQAQPFRDWSRTHRPGSSRASRSRSPAAHRETL